MKRDAYDDFAEALARMWREERYKLIPFYGVTLRDVPFTLALGAAFWVIAYLLQRISA